VDTHHLYITSVSTHFYLYITSVSTHFYALFIVTYLWVNPLENIVAIWVWLHFGFVSLNFIMICRIHLTLFRDRRRVYPTVPFVFLIIFCCCFFSHLTSFPSFWFCDASWQRTWKFLYHAAKLRLPAIIRMQNPIYSYC